MAVLVGTSGWQYRDWRGAFYPGGVAQRRWLEHYAERFATVEVNSTFYRLPPRETFADWAARTPDDFTFALKASRYLTHIRFGEPSEPTARLMAAAAGLGPKLGPVLLQLRDTVRADHGALEDVLQGFPAGTRIAFEGRHESWFTDTTAEILARHGAAWCLADTPKRRCPRWRSADWGYVRFHEGLGRPRPCYPRAVLERWAEELVALWPDEADVFVYFNNDPHACAVRDARRFAEVLRHCGRSVTRVPSAREVAKAGRLAR